MYIDKGLDFQFRVVEMESNNVVKEINAERLSIPASTLKVITAGAALYYLGQDYTFETAVYVDGEIKDGILNGNLILKGEGDPTLQTAQLATLSKKIKNMGIEIVRGSVIIDDRFYDQEIFNEGIEKEKHRFAYAAPTSALMLCSGKSNFAGSIRLDFRANQSGELDVKYEPNIKGLNLVNNVKVIKTKNENVELVYTGNELILTGHIVTDKPRSIWRTVSSPAVFTQAVFKDKVMAEGITIQNEKIESNELRMIANVQSMKLDKLIGNMILNSNNSIANSIVKAIGKKQNNEGSYKAGIKAIQDYLNYLNLDTENIVLDDGAGLSKNNRITAKFMTDYLYRLKDESYSHIIFGTLPIPGKRGTLKNRLLLSKVKFDLEAKTGTLIKCVNSLFGIFSQNDKKYIFFASLEGEKTNVELLDNLMNLELSRLYYNRYNESEIGDFNRYVVSNSNVELLCNYAIALEAIKRDLNVSFIRERKKIKLKIESTNQNHIFDRSKGDAISDEAFKICSNKQLTKKKLLENGIPTPNGKRFNGKMLELDNILAYTKELNFPIVMKPTYGSLGKGVFVNIGSESEVIEVYKHLTEKEKYNDLIVETYFKGGDYRIYVLGDEVIGAINRIPANVIGDGKSSIRELIKQKNIFRKTNPFLKKGLIKVDKEVLMHLENKSYTLETILPQDEVLHLRSICNASAGGDTIDVTDKIGEETKEIAVRAVKSIPGLNHGGVDVLIANVGTEKELATVIEINSRAEIGIHLFPVVGESRDISKALIDYYFPETETTKLKYYYDQKEVIQNILNPNICSVQVKSLSQKELFNYSLVATSIKESEYESILAFFKKNDINAEINKLEGSIIMNVLFDAKQRSQFEQFISKLKIDIYAFENLYPIKLGINIKDL